ncbi:MAG: OmpA family protein [Natronohydrobacter sp.]|nr:OmpA family protein [Natronohydrobacter sp.]
MTHVSRTVFAAGLALALSVTSAQAQSADDINTIIRGLAPIAGQSMAAPALTSPAPRGPERVLVELIIKERVIVIDPAHAMDFNVVFAFDSAELTPQARAELRALGRALESPELRPYRYLIAGHTDAVGDPAYNQRLSERRAAAVRDYLITAFAINPDRLIAVGFGEERLKDPANPRAGINRRVEVAMIVTP